MCNAIAAKGFEQHAEVGKLAQAPHPEFDGGWAHQGPQAQQAQQRIDSAGRLSQVEVDLNLTLR